MILTGPATNLARVLNLRGIKELIERRVRLLAVEAGARPEGDPDYNITHDISAARKLFAEWPTPIVVVGPEIGRALQYPVSSIENDFHWTDRHPVADAYRKAVSTLPAKEETADYFKKIVEEVIDWETIRKGISGAAVDRLHLTAKTSPKGK